MCIYPWGVFLKLIDLIWSWMKYLHFDFLVYFLCQQEETKQAQLLALAIVYFSSVLMVSKYRSVCMCVCEIVIFCELAWFRIIWFFLYLSMSKMECISCSLVHILLYCLLNFQYFYMWYTIHNKITCCLSLYLLQKY